MASNFIMHEGRLCRVTESYEGVDMGQLELKVAQDESGLTIAQDELTALRDQLTAKEQAVEDRESILEDSKRELAMAQTLVGEPGDAEEAQGMVLAEAGADTQPEF